MPDFERLRWELQYSGLGTGCNVHYHDLGIVWHSAMTLTLGGRVTLALDGTVQWPWQWRIQCNALELHAHVQTTTITTKRLIQNIVVCSFQWRSLPLSSVLCFWCQCWCCWRFSTLRYCWCQPLLFLDVFCSITLPQLFFLSLLPFLVFVLLRLTMSSCIAWLYNWIFPLLPYRRR